MTAASKALFGLALAAAGCSLTSLAERESPIAVNRCDMDTSCPVGSCSGDGFCVADSGSLTTLLFAVSGSAQNLAGQQIFRSASVPKNGGSFTLALDGIAEVTGSVQAMVPAGCDTTTTFKGADPSASLKWLADGTIPVRMTFSPTARMLGLPAQSSITLTRYVATPESYTFAARFAAGKYDVYIEPFDVTAVQGEVPPENCAVPPELIRGVQFEGGVTFLQRLPAPSHLDLQIKLSDRSDLKGWMVDMLEPVTGRPISKRVALSVPTTSQGMLTYSVGLDYFPVLEGEQQVTGDEIVRISPPDALVAPSILFQRSALELFTKGEGTIDQLTVIPKPISFEGRVIDALDKSGVPATVTLTATELDGMPKGTLTAFTRNVQTDDVGTFSLPLLPGTYRVLVVPAAPVDPAEVPFAGSEEIWQIAATPAQQAGRAIQLSRSRAVSGVVITPSGDSARGVVVSAEPSPGTITSNVFARALGDLPLVPRASTAAVDDASGAFTLFADPGSDDKPNLFDFSVRPPTASNFAWYLVPRVPISSTSPEPAALSEIRLPAPVRLLLTVELSKNAASELLLAGSNLRVYALLDENGEPTDEASAAKSAVPVAEASLDAAAQATVLLPPALVPASP